MDQPARRVALVTGVSRRQGIGFAIARRLLADDLKVVIHSWSPHDVARARSGQPRELAAVIAALGGIGAHLAHVAADFADPDAPRRVIDCAADRFGTIDVLIANHAISGPGRLSEITSTDLDLTWAINARASVLLVQTFAERHDDSRPDGRVRCLPQASTADRWLTSCRMRSAREPCTR